MRAAIEKMRLTIILVFISLALNAQTRSSTLTATKNSYNFEIAISCGFTGQTSPEFLVFEKLISSKNYKQLKKLLYSKSIINQVLSTICINELLNRKLLSLKAGEKTAMLKIQNLEKKYFFCNGAVDHIEGKVSDIFKSGVNSTKIISAVLIKTGLSTQQTETNSN